MRCLEYRPRHPVSACWSYSFILLSLPGPAGGVAVALLPVLPGHGWHLLGGVVVALLPDAPVHLLVGTLHVDHGWHLLGGGVVALLPAAPGHGLSLHPALCLPEIL